MSRQEIKIMVILVNVFAIVSAVLFYTKKIRPEPFLLGSVIWILMVVSIWYILPYLIYNKASTFKDHFTIDINEREVRVENDKNYVLWNWTDFNKYFESPHFFHLYFNERSFFLLPKENISEVSRKELRQMFQQKIKK
jgi:cellulose synthase/poly-beta-1,6-N-acetylglucosamine synthase-like glycosyltransferase